MIEIKLTQDKVALIDDEDHNLVSQYKWRANFCHGSWYALASYSENKKQKTIKMHRLILGFPSGKIDHKDNDGLNNQRFNLRLANNQQNRANSRKDNKHKGKQCISQFKGVTFQNGRWKAHIRVNYKLLHLGYYSTQYLAAKIYDYAAIRHFGDFAKTNFPKGDLR